MTLWATLLQLAVAGSAGGLLTNVVRSLSERRKVSAEATKTGADAQAILTDTALKAATRSIESLERRLEQTTTELQAVRHHMGVLEVLLRQRGVPVPDMAWPPQRNGVA